MKIGTLTFHKTTNYGAILQTYGLQKYINELGVECEVIDYINQTLKERYDKNPFRAKNIRDFVKRILFYKNNVIIEKKFNHFTDKYIKLSKEKYNELNITSCENKYDKFIAGSDQIWNLALSGNDENYFMSFSKDKLKNNSYAASLGVSNITNNEEKEKMKKLIGNINKISVREKEAVDIIDNILPYKKVEQSLDPVFLLNKEEWIKIKSNEEMNEKYILVYQIAVTPNLISFAQQLSAKTGYKIYYISSSNKRMKNARNINTASPEDFINYIYNAEHIVTSSFHGFAMAIIFNKDVYYDLDDKKGNFSSRLDSLAKLIGITNRKINTTFIQNNFEDIEYNEVNKKLDYQVSKSQKYIKDILTNK